MDPKKRNRCQRLIIMYLIVQSVVGCIESVRPKDLEDVPSELPIVLSLQGSKQVGKYSIFVDVGTPSTTYKTLLDTASADLVITASSCHVCHRSPSYDSKTSETSQSLCVNGSSCEFFESFGTGFVSGVGYKDTLAIADQSFTNVSFGAWWFENGLKDFLPSEYSGVFGLSPYPPLVEVGSVSLVQMLFNQMNLNHVISVCFGEYGGTLMIGGYDQTFYTGS